MKKIFILTLIAGALLLSDACQREGVLYDFPKDAALLTFPNNKIGYQMLPEDGNKIVVELYRGNTKGDLSVPFEFKDKTDGVFVPAKTTFDFADGEAVATVDINYPSISDFGGETYEMELAIDEETVSPSGYDELKVTAQRKLTLVSLGEGSWISGFYSLIAGEVITWPQELLTAEESPDYFNLPDCWEEGYPFTFTVSDGVITWPDLIDTGVASEDIVGVDLGNLILAPISCTYASGKMTLTAMPSVFYSGAYIGILDEPIQEIFTLPEGVSF